MNKLEIFFKLILCPIISILVLYSLDSNIFLYPLIFSFFIFISNYELLKLNVLYGFILGFLLSYVAFFAGIFSYNLFYKIINNSNITNDISVGTLFYTDLAGCISIFILAPFLTIYLQKLLFNDTKSKFTTVVLITTIIILTCLSFLYNNQKEDNIFNVFNIWYLIVMISLQLIINQKAIVNKANLQLE